MQTSPGSSSFSFIIDIFNEIPLLTILIKHTEKQEFPCQICFGSGVNRVLF